MSADSCLPVEGPDRVVETGDQAGAADCAGCLRTAQAGYPELGALTLDYDVLSVPEADQTIVVYSAGTGTATASALELLRLAGRT
ncbi:hypothetical protein ABZV91_29075 [Nocardia sp. NPDC004568]|uniref:MmyB family transcriptional regulator n=1 Tax=Nocardia sp. NPDC004568 TaxID=3154551 RepID=UPI0033A851C0